LITLKLKDHFHFRALAKSVHAPELVKIE